MDFEEAYDKLRKAKREALAKVGTMELNKALEALADKIKKK